MEEHYNNKHINRREFLKIVGITAATSTAALYGCSTKENNKNSSSTANAATGKMTYRSFPGIINDKISILGYGCMRWPTVPSPDGKGDLIDQDAVNKLVDYAMAHGVNYYDTSPVYVQGWSEKATGIALKRYPRESFKIATKLSNFSNFTRDFLKDFCHQPGIHFPIWKPGAGSYQGHIFHTCAYLTALFTGNHVHAPLWHIAV